MSRSRRRVGASSAERTYIHPDIVKIREELRRIRERESSRGVRDLKYIDRSIELLSNAEKVALLATVLGDDFILHLNKVICDKDRVFAHVRRFSKVAGYCVKQTWSIQSLRDDIRVKRFAQKIGPGTSIKPSRSWIYSGLVSTDGDRLAVRQCKKQLNLLIPNISRYTEQIQRIETARFLSKPFKRGLLSRLSAAYVGMTYMDCCEHLRRLEYLNHVLRNNRSEFKGLGLPVTGIGNIFVRGSFMLRDHRYIDEFVSSLVAGCYLLELNESTPEPAEAKQVASTRSDEPAPGAVKYAEPVSLADVIPPAPPYIPPEHLAAPAPLAALAPRAASPNPAAVPGTLTRSSSPRPILSDNAAAPVIRKPGHA